MLPVTAEPMHSSQHNPQAAGPVRLATVGLPETQFWANSPLTLASSPGTGIEVTTPQPPSPLLPDTGAAQLQLVE